MRPAFDGVDIVGVGEKHLVDRVGPLQRDFDVNTVAHAFEENRIVQRLAALGERGDVLLNSSLVMKLLALAGALVTELHLQACVQVRHLTQITRYEFVLEMDLGENFRVRRKRGLGAGGLGDATLLDLHLRSAALVAMDIKSAALVNFYFEFLAERVDD